VTPVFLTSRIAKNPFGLMLGAAALWAVAAIPVHALETGGKASTTAPNTAPVGPVADTGEWSADQLPTVLSEEDVERYRDIFEIQEDGDWKAADKLIAELENPILMGHVLAQRYLHPTKYRTSYKELKAWLDKYADHPDAKRLYDLALRRRPSNWKMPRVPTGRPLYGSGHDGAAALNDRPPVKRLSRKQRRQVRSHERKLAWYLRKGWTLAAKKLIQSDEVKRVFDKVRYDRAKAKLGAGYYAAGRDEWALQWAGEAAARSGKYLPEAHWTAGLAAWRLKRYDLAAKHFAEVAVSRYTSPWLHSAGAFWAARAELRSHRPERVNEWLKQAADHPRTFYGLLAREQLGLPVEFDWAPPPLAQEALNELAGAPGGERAVALLQAGEDFRAEREFRYLFGQVSPDLAHAMLALADRADMPSLAMRLGNVLMQNGTSFYDSAAYPLSRLTANDGRVADRALILALIRQESGFNPRAKSHAGARGLMQIMPRTASFIAQDRGYRGRKRRALFDPEINVTLGQRYIDILLNESYIAGDLFLMVTAWNAGPGNLSKWRKGIKHDDDPLLFIESIPLRETRIFVERVVSNFWIYRSRLGEPTPSLTAVASGAWPAYVRMNRDGVEVAQDDHQKK